MSPEQARGEEAGPQSRSLRARRPVLRDAHRAAAVPLERSRDAARDAAHARRRRARARSSPTRHPQAEAIILRLLEKERRKRYRDAHHLHEELKALQRSLPSHAVGASSRRRQNAPRLRRLRRRSRPASSSGRPAPRSSRAWCRAPTRPATRRPRCTTGARAGVGSRRARQPPRGRGREPHAQARGARAPRPRAARRDRPQGRGARARRVAHAARGRRRRRGRARRSARELSAAEKVARDARQLADAALRQGTLAPRDLRARRRRRGDRRGQARAARPLRGARRPPARRRARDLRRQIEELRASSRATPRRSRRISRRAARRSRTRTREGLELREGVQRRRRRCCSRHLRGKPECRDLVTELLNARPRRAQTAARDRAIPARQCRQRQAGQAGSSRAALNRGHSKAITISTGIGAW